MDKAIRMYNYRVKALFDIIFPEVEKRITVRHNVKWFDSEENNVKLSVENMKTYG